MEPQTTKALDIVHLAEGGQLTLPVEYQRAFALTPGAALIVMQVGDALFVAPQDAIFNATCAPLEAAWKEAGMSLTELPEALREVRQHVAEREFGALFEDQP